jgi:hypothetical protein
MEIQNAEYSSTAIILNLKNTKMGKFSNVSQVVYAATTWVFGGDNSLSGREQKEMKEAVNDSKTPWSVDEDDIHWVVSLWKGNDIQLDDIQDAVDNEFNFSLEDKFLLYRCVCIPMNALKQGDNSKDGWGRAHQLRDALGIESDDYNRWTKR